MNHKVLSTFLAWAATASTWTLASSVQPQRSFLRSLEAPDRAALEACRDKLLDLCDSAETPATCGDCAKDNIDALADAGCTETGVRAFCGRRGKADNESNEDNTQCTATLSEVCSSVNAVPACNKCVEANTGAVTEAGCSESEIRKFCQATEYCPEDEDCYNQNFPLPIPPTVLPPGTVDRPLQIFIQSGQSNCAGQSSTPMMNEDTNPSYDNLKGTQEGVWYAGFQGIKQAGPERFFIGPMIAGQASSKRNMLFGPEVGIGNRIYEAMEGESDILIIKYCWGGSNIYEEWNPRTEDNSWDREADNQTAEWLLEESGAVALGKKTHLYANLIYTVRRTLDALDSEDIIYDLAGLFWLQGAADKQESDWKEYGDNSVALFEQIRTDLEAPTMPIVDDGIIYHNVNTGKNYAASIIKGCNYIVTAGGYAATNPDDDCLPGAGKTCPNSTFINWDVFEFYGYDPNFPEDYKPPGASDKIFHWFAQYPINQHGEYEGDILTGRNLANSYIRSFTTYGLLPEWLAEDSNELFPRPVCDPDVNDGKPSDDNVCWMDERDDAAREAATCDPINCEEILVTSKASISGGSKPNIFFFFLNDTSKKMATCEDLSREPSRRPTAQPSPTPAPSTKKPSSIRPSSIRPSSIRPSTTQPTTRRPTTRPTEDRRELLRESEIQG